MDNAFTITADLDTPVSAFLKLGEFHPRFLLESVEGGDRLGRFSFIGFGDGIEVELDGDTFRIGNDRQSLPPTTAGLLELFRSALQRAPAPAPTPLPGIPFRGGLVGVTGFDLNRRFDGVRHGTGHPQARFFAPASILIFDHLTRRVALLHDGSEADRAALERAVRQALRGPIPPRPRITGHATPQPSLARPDFLHAIDQAKHHITLGDVYQLVLSIRFEGACDVPPFEAYRALRLLNPSPYLYFCDFDDLAVVGSSPEALVRLEGRAASLRPIAGTRPRGTDPASDEALERELLADPKELAEHTMLVDLARNDLGRVGVPGSIHVEPSMVVERYSHVMHIVSGVEGVLSPGRDAFDLFAATFPAGTVVGAPKIRAMEIIDDLEPVPRGFYAGTVGYFGHGTSMDQAIAIRTLTFRNGTYRYQAGAGIVADSVPVNEHAEVLAKAAALEAALTLAEEGL